ncbi:MAG TPA: bifunctional demethylmenaquinone methyltransferase/2-methoxy-6-polyprenyl-1,4-benzoquinol methylase UbiE [Caulifigura sp.]|nr:bifunctional demethylmenaquinone methyltransferase/2-methoxy-6-polyprenyl-1,4-benzoquinol methylase UbiE [Caulifigura sp.]
METAVDKSGDRIKRMFGGIAPRYDLLNHTLSGGVDTYWRARTVRLVKPEGTEPILDLCTGTGDLAFAYAKAGRLAVPIVGADFTPEMIDRANQKLKRAEAAGKVPGGLMQFQVADAQELPFENDRFQIVSVAFGLRNVADTMRGLREMTRVCRPGGRVAVLEFSKPQSKAFNAVYQAYFRTVLPRVGQIVSGSRDLAYEYLPQSVAEFPCGRELAGMMEQTGLESVQFKPLTFGIATLYWGRKPSGGAAASSSETPAG